MSSPEYLRASSSKMDFFSFLCVLHDRDASQEKGGIETGKVKVKHLICRIIYIFIENNFLHLERAFQVKFKLYRQRIQLISMCLTLTITSGCGKGMNEMSYWQLNIIKTIMYILIIEEKMRLFSHSNAHKHNPHQWTHLFPWLQEHS